jgi:S-adenosylmethionine:tRNA ribosyltransferase-isomerase
MTLNEFNFALPQDLIATIPLKNRDHSRLMGLDRTTQTITHHPFTKIIDYLTPNDVLVLNDTKVIKARLFATRKSGGKIEIFLNQHIINQQWSVLLKPAKRVTIGETLTFNKKNGPSQNTVTIIEKHPEYAIAEFNIHTDFFEFLDQFGTIPLPPYIQSKLSENQINSFESNYQTHYAKIPGAIAAPTAGLHFTPTLLNQLREKGVQIETITLHIGLGTFQPLKTTDLTQVQLHEESYVIEPHTAHRLTTAIHHPQKRIIAVGTTSVRTIESAFSKGGIQAGHGKTRLFIYPGYTFKGIDAMITNFHLPKSSLLLLVSAFAGQTLTKTAYQNAIEHQYRFYSFGDAMLIHS